jgi:hypothetical protein
MKRVVIGFFLSLLFLLTGGYTQVYAHSIQEKAFFAAKNIVTHNLPSRDKFSHSSDASAIEEEEDDNNSSKKFLDYTETSPAQYFNQYSVQGLPFGKPFVNPSHACSYILFRVFRI